jgi:hypothetical protein
MAYVAGYAQVVDAVLSGAAWDEAYFSILSLKAHCQSLPGYQRMDFMVRDLDSGDVDVTIVTNFEYLEQLSVWLEHGQTPDAILSAMEPQPSRLRIDVRENMS